MKRRKGSLTVEAIISFTVFISVMFLLLTLVKLVMVMTILNNATVETAKTIATCAYPISFLNEAQAGLEKMESNLEPSSLADSIKSTVGMSMTSKMLGGDIKSVAKSGATNIAKNLIGGAAVKLLKGSVYTIKGEVVHYLCGLLVNQHVQESGIAFDPEKLVLRMAKIPESDGEFKSLHGTPLSLSEKGTLSATPCSTPDGQDGQFNATDVVICLEYPYQIALPLIPSFEVTLRSVSVEHAWINGTSSGPKRTEGIRVDNLLFGKETTVYIATGGHGKRYHKPTCHLLWDSREKSSVSSAVAQGFTPCKVCKPDDAN